MPKLGWETIAPAVVLEIVRDALCDGNCIDSEEDLILQKVEIEINRRISIS